MKYTYFNAEVPPIYVVSQEEVSRVGWATADFEELHKVVLDTATVNLPSVQRTRWLKHTY